MKVYLDTSIVSVQVFGGFSDREQERHAETQGLFARIDAGDLDAIVSFYVLQELYTLSVEFSGGTSLETFARDVIVETLQHRVGLFRLLTREERLIHRRRFTLADLSDEPHVIVALVSGCDAIVTYDTHFDDVRDCIPVLTPVALLT